MGYRIRFACLSHPGKIRSLNQDNYICNGSYAKDDPMEMTKPLLGKVSAGAGPIFGVFDGLGGEQHGEKAAAIAAQAAAKCKPGKDPVEDLSALCRETNGEICRYAREEKIQSTGTTAAMLAFTKNKIALCNIGDSKIFRFWQGALEQISKDHLGIAPFGVKPPLSQCLGTPPEQMRIAPYFAQGNYQDGCVYLICSDGLTDMLNNQAITRALTDCPIEKAATRLLDEALAGGGKDNITLILCQIENPFRRWFCCGKKEERGKKCQ